VVARGSDAESSELPTLQEKTETELWEQLWDSPDPLDQMKDKRSLDERMASAQELIQKKKVMIMISDTGGGHRASAVALADALEEQFPGRVSITIRDVWTEDCPFPFNMFVPVYTWCAKRTLFWRFLYLYGKFPITRWLQQRTANFRCLRAFRYAILRDDPDLIISVHPLCQHITLKCLRRLARRYKRRIPFVTVVTDLGAAHPLWFHPEADRVFVPSQNVRQIAIRCGVRRPAIHMHGLPLRRAFWTQDLPPQIDVRARLGLADLRTALIVGGGDGVGKIRNVAEAVGRELGQLGKAQLVVVCGKNTKVLRQLSTHSWPEGLETRILGFVSNMDEWMAAADVIVTKAGPGTIAEANTRGLPIMLSAFLPGQEKGNVDFVIDGGFGDFSSDPKIIARTVTGWLRDPAELERRSRLSKAMSRPGATLEIADEIGRTWLAMDTEDLLKALVREMRVSAAMVHANRSGDAAEDQSARLRELQDAHAQLQEADQHAKDATRNLTAAKARVRDMLTKVLQSDEVEEGEA